MKKHHQVDNFDLESKKSRIFSFFERVRLNQGGGEIRGSTRNADTETLMGIKLLFLDRVPKERGWAS